ncbi:MAG: SPASM domain-containing protein [Bdellovibrionota bacterium]
MFEKLYIEISNICNLQCTFCPEVIREKKILSVADFKKFAAQAKPLTKQVCLHLMGEPLAHPQFSEIMDVCDELDLKIFLTTNATLLKKHQEKLLKWRSLEQINFSVHSFFANPAKMSLLDYISPILNFCDQANQLNANYYINLRLWNLEKTDQQNNQNAQVFDILNKYFNVSLNEVIDVKHNKSKKIQEKLYIHFDTEFIWPALNQEIRSSAGSCYGLRKQLAIHANGDVVPCCLDKETVLKLGNINESKLTDIMKSERALKIKSGFERGELVEDLCQRCQYADRFRK